MCGRFARTSPRQILEATFGLAIDPAIDLRPRYNVCPGEPVLAVVSDGHDRRAGWLRWGLVPFFAKDAKGGPRAINARVETAATNPTFRDAFRRHRCLVPADGFYEWRGEGPGRAPHYVRAAAGGPFAFAGLWDRWRPADGGEPLVTCALLTQPADPTLADIHDRMPVIVPPDAFGAWLDRSVVEPEAIRGVLAAMRPPPWVVHPVSRLVNSPRNDAPELILKA
jgi:putative SOS response-associated peptidase YedK